MTNAHAWETMTVPHALDELRSSVDGLDAAEARARQASGGPNALPADRPQPVVVVFFRQFWDPLVLVLIGAAVTSWAASGELVDALIILILVVVNAVIGTAQELTARRSLDALRATLSPSAVVVRDATSHRIPADELVVGDVVLLTQGDRVPADVRLIEATSLAIDESALTGESIPVDKATEAIPAGLAPADQSCMGFSSSFVTRGRGAGVVVAIGTQTHIGRIAETLRTVGHASTPLQRQLARVGLVATIVVVSLAAVLFVVGLAQGRPVLPVALLAVSLAVAAIPEGLVAISSIILAGGVRRMARRGAIIRTLPSVETLGSASVICVDKTGTLTQNRMVVPRSWEPGGPDEPSSRILQIAALCNDAPWVEADGTTTIGDPMETALAQWVEGRGLSRLAVDRVYPRRSEIPFDASRKLMTTVHAAGNDRLVLTKGGVDEVLALCPGLTDAQRAEILRVTHGFAADGLRVIACADRTTSPLEQNWEHTLEFVGLIGLEDPLREHAAHTVERCSSAGVTTVMVTGDHPATATTIAMQLGMLEGREVVSAPELAAMTDAELRERVSRIGVFARATPESKVRIVAAWQSHGAIVAMTGDGVNDGPALRAADVGCAMGRSGTDVARAAADVVITDDDFATIVDAIEEGRRTHTNLTRALAFLLGTNAGEVVLLVAAVLAGLAAPLAPAHILIINLITDGAPALALAADPADKDVMSRPPSPPTLITRAGLARVVAQGALFGGAALVAFLLAGGGDDLLRAQTVTFLTLALSQLIHTFSVRADAHTVFTGASLANRWLLGATVLSVGLVFVFIYVPPLATILGLAPLSASNVVLAVGLAASTLLVVEASKALWRARSRRLAR